MIGTAAKIAQNPGSIQRRQNRIFHIVMNAEKSTMSIKILRKRAIEIIKKKGVRQESDEVFYVKDGDQEYRVQFKTLPGRTIYLCSCSNHAFHCRQPIICVHKLAAEWVGMFNQINRKEAKNGKRRI